MSSNYTETPIPRPPTTLSSSSTGERECDCGAIIPAGKLCKVNPVTNRPIRCVSCDADLAAYYKKK